MRPYSQNQQGSPRLDPPVVIKFGGSVLRSVDAMPMAAHEIYRILRRGHKVVAVTSALHGQTDALLDDAHNVFGDGAAHNRPALLRLGEMRSAALLALALERIGVDARAVDPAQIGLLCPAPADEAKNEEAIVQACDTARLKAFLERHDVVVVPGFSACDEEGFSSLLGRGGSDQSAVFLASALGAEKVRMIKNVDGLYESDPFCAADAPRFSSLDYDHARRVCGPAIQKQALDLADSQGITLDIAMLARHHGSTIAPTRPARIAHVEAKRLKVALLGCGTVGAGVYQHLARHDDLFDVCAILVNDLEKKRDVDIPAALLGSDPAQVFAARPDIVVEMIGGVDTADAFIRNAFFGGADVVSANKAVLAKRFSALHKAAAQAGRVLRYSAAVGGGVPMLEALDEVREKAAVSSLRGVINGTANFILDRLADGAGFEDAVREAQEKGFAESDPSADLDGDDAAAKLVLMARRGFGRALPVKDIACDSLRDLSAQTVRQARENGDVIRQVSTISRRQNGRLRAAVRLEALPADDFLALAKGERNRLEFTDESGAVHGLQGKGAGRWPTAEAVFADLLDIHRLRAQNEVHIKAMPDNEPVCA